MNFRHIVYWVVALVAIRALIAVVTPVFETSEARYAAISANMARTGDFLVPRFTYREKYQSYEGKPPLQFQLSGLSCRWFGVNEFAVRLPILLAMSGLLLFLYYTVSKLTDRRRGILATAVCASSVALYALMGFSMPDGLLTPCVATAYLAHLLFLRTGQRNWSLVVFAALAFGMLDKGPVAIVLFAFPVFVDACVNHHWRAVARYRWLTGGLLFVAIAAPWFVLMEREMPGFLRYFFVNENLMRFLVHDYGDKYGAGREFFSGVAILWAIVVTLPWTPFVAFTDWRKCPQTLAIGILGIVFFWALTSRVPLAYLMPVVPLFSAHLAMDVRDEKLLARIVPCASVLAVVALAGTLAVTRLTTHKLPGAKASFDRRHYSYEFYHGTPDSAKEVAK